MSEVELVTLLLLAVGLLAALAASLRIAHPVVLVLGGLALGFVPGAPDIRLDPDVVFLLFLPPILYAAAFTLAAEDVRENLRPIGFLAVGLVMATVGAVALVAHYGVGLDWGPSFVLGAVLGPTDPVAATAVIRRLGAPSRIATILEGESLVNDGVALVALRVAIGATGASFSAPEAVLEFVWNVGAGSVIGLLAGFLATLLRRRSEQPLIDITLALVTTYGAFLAAEVAHVSGILASVAAGLFVGYRAMEIGSPEGRIQAYSFWEVAVFLVESALFVISGLVFQQVLSQLGDRSVLDLAGYAALVIATVVGLRALWMFTVPNLYGLLDPRGGGTPSPVGVRERAVLGAASMRGAVTIAAALSIPLAVGGDPFPDRDLVLFLAYATVVVTLVVPTLALPRLLRSLGLVQSDERRREALEARLDIAHAALARVEELAGEGNYSEGAMQRARDAYEMRITRAQAGGHGPEDDGAVEAYRELRRDLVETERRRLAELREERKLPGDTVREIERELDLEEARLSG